ncbi:MAG: NAD(P)-dependent oxidoreductase [Oscillospiraceae bacterium]|jgi:nucleoside-diphosphate-sugar epimerase|nr:NAD(P)-dependent oxidoreductase [Oscillospiraceae bacterium]
MEKKTVFLTGASGNMGWQGFQQLYQRKHRFQIVVLNLDTRKIREQFAAYANDPCVTLLWGNLRNYSDVLAGVTGADIVLHVGGMVSPSADNDPKGTISTNVTAARNIVRAVKAQPNPDAIKVVYIGSVAQTGERDAPIHWGRCGDPIKISVYDHYGISKSVAELVFAESGLRHWVSLRQSGILYANIVKSFDPIMFHVPINGVLEWSTLEDSGRLLANVCEDWVPEHFWRRFYNIGSGSGYRLTNFEFEQYLLRALGLGGDPRKIFRANWFALRNFHGQWYADSDELEDYLHFRGNKPVEQYFHEIAASLPWYYRLAKIAPRTLVRIFGMRRLALKPLFGTIRWVKSGIEQRIRVFFGSLDDWRKIGSWKNFEIKRPSGKIALLNHGYDESKPLQALTTEDLRAAAAFRGGALLSETYSGDPWQPLRWRCAHGHEFSMSLNTVLRGGYWCPGEFPGPAEGDWRNPFIPWNYGEEARVNPFFAQVWYPLHSEKECHVYGEEIFQGMKGYETENKKRRRRRAPDSHRRNGRAGRKAA